MVASPKSGARGAAKTTSRRVAPKPAASKPAASRRARSRTAPEETRGSRSAAGAGDVTGLRVRMYRVGFGDFFLMTVPSAQGPQHILIDCGVTTGKTGKGDIHTIKGAVAHMAAETGRRLALIIVTHRHMDHIIGFSRCAAEFRQFQVGAVWMPYWETEYQAEIVKFQADLEALALDVHQHLALAGANDSVSMEILGMLENATGVSLKEGPGGGSNRASLELLKKGLGVTPSYYYKGQEATLPPDLVAAGLGATILGPPPADEAAFMKLTDLKKGVGQYLAASAGGGGEARQFAPFAAEWKRDAAAYPLSAFREWAPRRQGVRPDFTRRHADALEKAIAAAQPAMLLTAAKQLDAFLNNQSLVVLFTFNGRKLLFAGDAQAGNWESWLFDTATPSKTGQGLPLSAQGAAILRNLQFYKVGHHGSTNATPIAAVEAMGEGITALCSTQSDTFGSVANQSEVPRGPLLDALARKNCALVRSDQIAAKVGEIDVPPAPDAPGNLPQPSSGRLEIGSCYVDYFL